MQNLKLVPLGYQQITLASSAVSLTVPPGATSALISAETSGIRWRDDGTAPTATVGFPLAAAATLEYWGTLSAVQVIAQSGSPVVDISYYRAVG